MSHWSHSRLTLTGPAHELRRFRASFEKSRVFLDFAGTFPITCPHDNLRAIRQWREESWGFSGALYLRFPKPGETGLTYEFLTRPGPAVRWAKGMAKVFPELTVSLAYTVGGIREHLLLPGRPVEDEVPALAA